MIDTYASIIAYENGPSWSPLRTTGILVTRGSREWITLLWLAKLQFFSTMTRSASDDIGIHSLSGAHHITQVLATLHLEKHLLIIWSNYRILYLIGVITTILSYYVPPFSTWDPKYMLIIYNLYEDHNGVTSFRSRLTGFGFEITYIRHVLGRALLI